MSLEAEGIILIAMSYDAVDVLSRFSESSGLGYTLLSDSGSLTIKAYGVLNEAGDGIPHPTVFIIDEEGIIQAKLRYEGYKTRHNSVDIIAAVNELKGAGG